MFRKNRISPTVSDNPQSNEDTWADGNLTDNNRDTAHASRCVILRFIQPYLLYGTYHTHIFN